MSEDWPSPPQRSERARLPRVEDLPVVSEGYDRARVDEAFEAFYRHLAQLDSTLRTLEAVEVFRRQASELRADLRSIRAAGWSPYPRGYPVEPELGRGYDVPAAVPRIALEVVFLIVVAVIVAVANFKSLEIVLVMVAAFAITALVEWIASLERRAEAPPTAATSVARSAPAAEPAVQAGPLPEPMDEGAGWAAFAEPSGPEALTVMGALSDTDEEAQPEPAAAVDPKPEPDPAKKPDPDPERVTEATEELPMDDGSRRRWAWRRRAREAEEDGEGGEVRARPPKHVRILAPPEPALKRDLDPWERGFDFADDAAEADVEAPAEEDEAPLRPQ